MSIQRDQDPIWPGEGQEVPEWLEGRLRDLEDRDRGPEPPPGGRAGGPRRLIALALAALLIASAGYGLAAFRYDLGAAPVSEGRPPTSAPKAGPVTVSRGEPVAAVAASLLPSVVQIETNTGLGTGVIYDEDGFILTAAHVVEGTSDVVVRLADGTRVRGDVVGADPATDVAVVRANSRNLDEAPLAIGVPVRVGQIAVAIGSPFGLEQTVTAGVVSAVDRSIPTDNGQSITNMIQTDAPINPGNSGGALADRQGRVIGLNDAIRSDSGVNAGVGFAIPIDTAVQVADDLVQGRKPTPGFLGVSGTTPATGEPGALVTEVIPDTPAAEAGLRQGDLITSIEGAPIQSMVELAGEVRATDPGTTVTMQVRRNGRQIELQATIGKQ